MIIKRLQARYKDVPIKQEDGSVLYEQVESGYEVVLKEIPALTHFEQLQKPDGKGVYKKRCIVFTDNGEAFIVPYSFEELIKLKTRTPIGFTIVKINQYEPAKRARRRNLPQPDVKRRTGVLPDKLRDILPEKKEDESSESLQ